MVEAMHESNALMGALKTLMEQVVVSNEALHNDLKLSQSGSHQLQQDMKEVKQQVNFLYAKEI